MCWGAGCMLSINWKQSRRTLPLINAFEIAGIERVWASQEPNVLLNTSSADSRLIFLFSIIDLDRDRGKNFQFYKFGWYSHSDSRLPSIIKHSFDSVLTSVFHCTLTQVFLCSSFHILLTLVIHSFLNLPIYNLFSLNLRFIYTTFFQNDVPVPSSRLLSFLRSLVSRYWQKDHLEPRWQRLWQLFARDGKSHQLWCLWCR